MAAVHAAPVRDARVVALRRRGISRIRGGATILRRPLTPFRVETARIITR